MFCSFWIELFKKDCLQPVQLERPWIWRSRRRTTWCWSWPRCWRLTTCWDTGSVRDQPRPEEDKSPPEPPDNWQTAPRSPSCSWTWWRVLQTSRGHRSRKIGGSVVVVDWCPRNWPCSRWCSARPRGWSCRGTATTRSWSWRPAGSGSRETPSNVVVNR